MSYLVLARKYRPQTFDELAGQEFVSTALKNAIALNRVSHSYLFTGARGVGKTSAARILAKALNCLNPIDCNPCNECEHCKEITNGTSIDVLEIDGASNRGIDEIRQLREAVKFIPVKYKYKVYIVDEVHMLTGDASNALLKTLEEPPSYVVFIFATTDVHKMLPTILSRCQRYDFVKIPYDDMHKALENIYTKEGIKYEPDALSLVIRQSEGCMRDALSFSDQIISYTNSDITYDAVAGILGVSGDPVIADLYAAVLEENVSVLDGFISSMSDRGCSFTYAAEKLITHTRNLLLLKNGAQTLKKELTKAEEKYYSDLLEKTSEERLFALFQVFQKLHNELKYSSFPRYVFEFGLYKASSLSRIIPLPANLAPVSQGIVTERSAAQVSGKQSEAQNTAIKAGQERKPEKKATRLSNDSSGSLPTIDKTPAKEKFSSVPEETTMQNAQIKGKKNGENSSTLDSSHSINNGSGREEKAYGETVNKAVQLNSNSNILSGGELRWHELLTELKSVEAGLASSLFHSRMEEKDGNVILYFPKERMFNYRRASTDANIKKLENFLSEKLTCSVRVQICFDGEENKSLAVKKDELESVYEKKIKEDFAAHPAVSDLIKDAGIDIEDLKVIKND